MLLHVTCAGVSWVEAGTYAIADDSSMLPHSGLMTPVKAEALKWLSRKGLSMSSFEIKHIAGPTKQGSCSPENILFEGIRIDCTNSSRRHGETFCMPSVFLHSHT